MSTPDNAPPLPPGWRASHRRDNSSSSLMLVPTGRSLGAEVLGVDLAADIPPGLADALRAAWAEYLVLLFRGQRLSPDAQVQAARVFGEPEEPAAAKYYRTTNRQAPNHVHPLVMQISNLGPAGLPVAENDGLGSGEVVWHSDNSYVDAPPDGSMLYALEVPPQGGDTAFSNQYLAFETLAEDIRARIEQLGAVHDSSRNSAGVLRPGVHMPTKPSEVPGPVHPLVRTHPVTRRKALYLGRRRAYPSQYIPGLPEDESDRLLDLLWTHASRPELAWAHQWRAGDVLVWDNRAAMHHRDPHDPRFPRIMHRVQLAGTKPV